ncbi:hypothetical protein B0T17DRAFT_507898 [Bombardia bombarda]|uniref:Uncharacterized protein n=1 Tax=Bombardia bombarda TaxID=252184 RepID=A0AA40C4M3_9PEZI|nr:hypothetical protein B0T17DRAFT_507898 [Bombardia bombarda]
MSPANTAASLPTAPINESASKSSSSAVTPASPSPSTASDASFDDLMDFNFPESLSVVATAWIPPPTLDHHKKDFKEKAALLKQLEYLTASSNLEDATTDPCLPSTASDKKEPKPPGPTIESVMQDVASLKTAVASLQAMSDTSKTQSPSTKDAGSLHNRPQQNLELQEKQSQIYSAMGGALGDLVTLMTDIRKRRDALNSRYRTMCEENIENLVDYWHCVDWRQKLDERLNARMKPLTDHCTTYLEVFQKQLEIIEETLRTIWASRDFERSADSSGATAQSPTAAGTSNSDIADSNPRGSRYSPNDAAAPDPFRQRPLSWNRTPAPKEKTSNTFQVPGQKSAAQPITPSNPKFRLGHLSDVNESLNYRSVPTDIGSHINTTISPAQDLALWSQIDLGQIEQQRLLIEMYRKAPEMQIPFLLSEIAKKASPVPTYLGEKPPAARAQWPWLGAPADRNFSS